MFYFRTRSASREDKSLVSYLESSPNPAWLDNCYEAEGPLYQCTLSMLLLTPARWEKAKLTHLKRMIILSHQRFVAPSGSTKTISDTTTKDYSVYKNALIFFGLIDTFYTNLFKVRNFDQFLAFIQNWMRFSSYNAFI